MSPHPELIRLRGSETVAARVSGSHLQAEQAEFLSCDRNTGSCIYLRQDLYMSHGFVGKNITYTHNGTHTNTCDMYKSCLRHIHDSVFLSQDRNYTCNFFE